MTRLQSLPRALKHRIEQRSLLKVISGLNNFDLASVELIAKAAGHGGADLIDVACEPSLISLASKLSGLPVCVSAVEPELFLKAVDAGASMVEIGNFDSFYPKGRFFEADEVILIAKETRALLPETVLSVTVPHILPLDEQAQLALDLIELGADIIQTEGGVSAHPISSGTLGMIEKAAPTLAATHSIAKAISMQKILSAPLLTASGLSDVTVPMAIAAGASGVGVGSAINRLNDELSMIAAIRSLRNSIDSHQKLIAHFCENK